MQATDHFTNTYVEKDGVGYYVNGIISYVITDTPSETFVSKVNDFLVGKIIPVDDNDEVYEDDVFEEGELEDLIVATINKEFQ